jgi:hypothetical protein
LISDWELKISGFVSEEQKRNKSESRKDELRDGDGVFITQRVPVILKCKTIKEQMFDFDKGWNGQARGWKVL